MMSDLLIQPAPGERFENWRLLAESPPAGSLFGYSQEEWREKARRELGLATDRPIIATGHQTLLWHPGILAKYLALQAASDAAGCAMANLVVDQHVDRFGEFEVPLRRADGSLAVRRIELARAQPEVPMALHEPFAAPPPEAPSLSRLPYASESIAEGVERIVRAIAAHANAPNAALQMAHALEDLMKPWVRPMRHITASELCETTLARALMQRMADEPRECALAYNRAVGALSRVPGVGIPSLLVRDDYVELPLWRIRPDGRRMRAYDGDVQAWLDAPNRSQLPFRGLMPRALYMTALVRLGMCDLFIHGTGGARYDRAMEQWIREWLGVEVAPIGVVTATLRLPLRADHGVDVERVRHESRHLWHDPWQTEQHDHTAMPSTVKRAMLDEIERLPRKSIERRRAFYAVHERLEAVRNEPSAREAVNAARRELDSAERAARDAAIASRRDWAFPLYPPTMIDELAAAVRDARTHEAAKRTA